MRWGLRLRPGKPCIGQPLWSNVCQCDVTDDIGSGQLALNCAYAPSARFSLRLLPNSTRSNSSGGSSASPSTWVGKHRISRTISGVHIRRASGTAQSFTRHLLAPRRVLGGHQEPATSKRHCRRDRQKPRGSVGRVRGDCGNVEDNPSGDRTDWKTRLTSRALEGVDEGADLGHIVTLAADNRNAKQRAGLAYALGQVDVGTNHARAGKEVQAGSSDIPRSQRSTLRLARSV